MKKIIVAIAVTCFTNTAYSADELWLECNGILDSYEIKERDIYKNPMNMENLSSINYSFILFIDFTNSILSPWNESTAAPDYLNLCRGASITKNNIKCTRNFPPANPDNSVVYDINLTTFKITYAYDGGTIGYGFRDGSYCRKIDKPKNKGRVWHD